MLHDEQRLADKGKYVFADDQAGDAGDRDTDQRPHQAVSQLVEMIAERHARSVAVGFGWR